MEKRVSGHHTETIILNFNFFTANSYSAGQKKTRYDAWFVLYQEKCSANMYAFEDDRAREHSYAGRRGGGEGQ